MWIFWSNNAGRVRGGKTFDVMTYEEWDRLIRINLTGATCSPTRFCLHGEEAARKDLHGQLRRGAGV